MKTINKLKTIVFYKNDNLPFVKRLFFIKRSCWKKRLINWKRSFLKRPFFKKRFSLKNDLFCCRFYNETIVKKKKWKRSIPSIPTSTWSLISILHMVSYKLCWTLSKLLRCSENCIVEETGKFAKRCAKQKGFFKCCVTV